MLEKKKEGLLTVIRIKTQPMPKREGSKSTKIKITQRDIDDLNRKIRKDIEEVEKARERGREIAERQIMK